MDVLSLFLIVVPLTIVLQGLLIIITKRVGGVGHWQGRWDTRYFEVRGENARKVGIVYVIAGIAMLSATLLSAVLPSDVWWTIWLLAWVVLITAHVVLFAVTR